MQIKVAKFGGTSLADVEHYFKVKSIVEEDPQRRYMITSAAGKRYPEDRKITDLLYICHAHVQQSIPFEYVLNIVEERYTEIVAKLGINVNMQEELALIKEKIINGASVDYIASRGEYLSAKILAELLGYSFVDAANLIFFTKKGILDTEKTYQAIAHHLGKIEKAVIPGFYGILPDGTIKTFPRGGSDITGALITRGIGANLYENWTDVSGFLMADPRIVPNPKQIELITYSELRELAYMGANVLHEESIFPVKEVNIPVSIRNTNYPKEPGTIIVKEKKDARLGAITGIAGRKDFLIISIEKALMNSERGFVRKLFSILEHYQVSVEHLPSGIDTVSVVIMQEEINGKLADVLADIERQLHPDKVEVFEDIALIATVGQGMAYTHGMAAKLFVALADNKVNVRMIDQGSSEINIIVGIKSENFEKAIKAIYNAFVT